MTSSQPLRPRLRADELYSVMLHATDDSIAAKFAVSQVCRLWRTVALRSGVLWSSFSVSTRVDAFRLPIVLGRTCKALMSVALDFSGYRRSRTDEDVPIFDVDDRLGIYRDISPHMPRVRVLFVDFGQRHDRLGVSEPLNVLFSFGIPRMEHLTVQWPVPRWHEVANFMRYRPVPAVRISLEAALRIRHVRLVNIALDDWIEVAVPTLEVLDVDSRIRDPCMLRDVIQNCPNLTSLTICPTDYLPFSFTRPENPVAQLRLLQKVHIGAPFATIWEVISPVIDSTGTRDIAVTIPGIESYDQVRDMYASLINAFSPVVSCSMSTTHKQSKSGPPVGVLDVWDALGRSRRIEISGVSHFREHLRALWRSLSFSEHGLRHIRFLSISRSVWLSSSEVFRDRCPDNSIEHLTVTFSEGSASDESFLMLIEDYPDIQSIPCPVLAKLTLRVDRDPSEKLRIVLSIIDLVECEQWRRPVELCIDTERRAPWNDHVQHKLSGNPRWFMCNHCVLRDGGAEGSA